MYQVLSFFFNDTATTEIYTLSLHDALPIYERGGQERQAGLQRVVVQDALQVQRAEEEHAEHAGHGEGLHGVGDRKSTRLNSSHANISYAVFCLKKKKCHPLFEKSLYHHITT